VSPSAEIWVQFAPVIDESTILAGEGIQVLRAADEQKLNGSWTVSHGGTKFTFSPDEPLERGTQYEVSVTRAVKDVAGTPLEAARKVRFRTAE